MITVNKQKDANGFIVCLDDAQAWGITRRDAITLFMCLRDELSNDEKILGYHAKLVNMDKADKILDDMQFKSVLLNNTIVDDSMPINEIHVIGAGGKKVIIKF